MRQNSDRYTTIKIGGMPLKFSKPNKDNNTAAGNNPVEGNNLITDKNPENLSSTKKCLSISNHERLIAGILFKGLKKSSLEWTACFHTKILIHLLKQAHHSSIKHLSLGRFSTEEIHALRGPILKNLVTLRIVNTYRKSSPSEIKELAKNLKGAIKLENFLLCDTFMKDDSYVQLLANLQLKSLKKLSLVFWRVNVDYKMISALVKTGIFPKLTAFRLRCKSINDFALTELLKNLEKAQNLENLTIVDSSDNDLFTSRTTNFKLQSLKRLRIGGEGLSHKTIDVLMNAGILSSLIEFRLVNILMNNNALKHLANTLQGTKNMNTLELQSVIFDSNPNFKENVFSGFFKILSKTHLRELHLCYYGGYIHDTALKELADNLPPELMLLNLNGSAEEANKAYLLKKLANHKKIKELYLNGHALENKKTLNMLVSFIIQSPELKVLDVSEAMEPYEGDSEAAKKTQERIDQAILEGIRDSTRHPNLKIFGENELSLPPVASSKHSFSKANNEQSFSTLIQTAGKFLRFFKTNKTEPLQKAYPELAVSQGESPVPELLKKQIPNAPHFCQRPEETLKLK